MFNQLKRRDCVKGSKNIDKKMVSCEGKNCFKTPGGINCFFRGVLHLCLRDKIQHDKISLKEEYIKVISKRTTTKEKKLFKVDKFCKTFDLLYE